MSVQPAYADPCVPPGHELVLSAKAPPPPDEVTVTTAVAVTLPAELVAVSV